MPADEERLIRIYSFTQWAWTPFWSFRKRILKGKSARKGFPLSAFFGSFLLRKRNEQWIHRVNLFQKTKALRKQHRIPFEEGFAMQVWR